MSENLPTDGFEQVKVIENFEFENIPDDFNIGYVLEIDLIYPKSLHDPHNDYFFCPEALIPKGSKQKNYKQHYTIKKIIYVIIKTRSKHYFMV